MAESAEATIGAITVRFETGVVAKQAGGAVTVRSGDTVVLVTATAGSQPREGVDFFPLTCDFEERMYAIGRIPGGRIKREGRPSEFAVLTSRLIDRPIRPLFPSGMRNEVQVVAMPLSVDQDNPPDVLAVTGASAALAVSDVPWPTPVAAVRVGRVEGQFIINPTWAQAEEGDLDLVVVGSKTSIVMVEAGAREVTEEDMLAAMAFGHEHIRTLVAAQEELAEKAGKPKREFKSFAVDKDLLQAVRDREAQHIRSAIQEPDKAAREAGLQILRNEIVANLAADFPERESELGEAVDKVIKEQVRALIIEEGKRPDGRGDANGA
jgi:polyribonucleotide nucleotidyltransferase